MSQSKAEELFLKAAQVNQKNSLNQLMNCLLIMDQRAEKGAFHCNFLLSSFSQMPKELYLGFFENKGFTCSVEEITDTDDPDFEVGSKVLKVSWGAPKANLKTRLDHPYLFSYNPYPFKARCQSGLSEKS